MDGMDVIILITIIIIIFGLFRINKENFDLTINMLQRPHRGRFNDCQLIGVNKGYNHTMCKDLCNKMDSCVGISYKGAPNNECRLYNDTSRIEFDPKYLSWYKFANRMIY